LTLSTGRIESLVWILIYGGLLVLAIGLALVQGGVGQAWSIVAAGIVIAAAGVVLIYVRSRMTDRSDG
jgi:membrane protein YdbS with pleckstrin-like domain